MNKKLSVALAQLDLFVGDVKGNAIKIIDYCEKARDVLKADLIVFPELALSGYPPEDLLFHSGYRRRINDSLSQIKNEVHGIAVLFGFPEYVEDDIYNSCAVYFNGDELASYRKHLLPNYSVFDEQRYFKAGTNPSVFKIKGIKVGLNICEDVWESFPALKAKEAGAEILIAINGSPYEIHCQTKREDKIRKRTKEIEIPIVYLNLVGGQDELVFDGASFVMDVKGKVCFRAPPFKEIFQKVDFKITESGVIPEVSNIEALYSDEQSVYEALVCGTRDYIVKNNFPGVILGLSGGIDSALTLAIACDSIGAKNVRAVMMPFKHTSTISKEDAAEQASMLGVNYDILPINTMYDAFSEQLRPIFSGKKQDVTEENIQARCRGLMLMSISNKTGCMLLTTGNKSEMAVGYATLYGDMAGGFAPLKDCNKTLVYRLAHYRNSIGMAIPERVISKEPSAELRENQKDSDSLPPYEILDPILDAFIEKNLSVVEIVKLGYDRDVVIKILEMVKRNEYKRRQTPPGIRISGRAFGRDWRYPITSHYSFPE